MPLPILRSDVLEMKDLKPGMVLKGTVRNVIDFGVFVDIGVHQDGLVHISEICDKYIKHPLEAVSVGDVVEVSVLSVDLEKQRIQLTMKTGGNNINVGGSKAKSDKNFHKGGKNASGNKSNRSNGRNDKNNRGDNRREGRKKGIVKRNNFFDGIVIK